MEYWVYFIKTPCIVEFEMREGVYHLCKIGFSENYSRRLNEFDMPFDVRVIEKVAFPNRESALVCELFLHNMFYSDYRLNQRGSRGRASEWFGLNDEQIENIREHLIQFKDGNVLNSFLIDAEVIREEVIEHGKYLNRFAKQYDLESPLKVKKYLVRFRGFDDIQLGLWQ